jgi:hypothetical protein
VHDARDKLWAGRRRGESLASGKKERNINIEN